MLVHSYLDNIGLEELTLAWNRCWKGYFYETHFSPAQMETWLKNCRVDLAHSVALKKGEQILGFSLLAVENNRGWIAGTCIDPVYRGQHLFEPLLLTPIHRAKERQLRSIQLEVLHQNHARKIYERIGFKETRELYVYRYNKGRFSYVPHYRSCFLRQVSLAEYFQAREAAGFNPSWQRREEYLQRYTSLKSWLNPYRTSGILLTKESSVLLDAWTVAWEQVEKLISSILYLAQGDFVLTNQPKDWLTAYLKRHGVSPSDIQYEMIYPMTTSR